MGLIPVNDLIALFVRMYREHWAYVWGAAREGCVDCSGAFVWAYEQFHKRIAHGSNSIARSYVVELLPIAEAKPGMAAFKSKSPGQSGYDLPDKFKKGGSSYNGDLNDYYHVGLVNDTASHVLNAQGTKAGFTRAKISCWQCCGYLREVDYNGGDETMDKFMVTAANGDPVRVRRSPSTTSEILDSLAVGTEVMAADDINGWRQITYGKDGAGYMMAKFLKRVDSQEDSTAYIRTLTPDEYNRLCEARDQVESALQTLKAIVGVG